MLEELLNLIYPNICGFCNKINKNNICTKCNIKLQKYKNKNNIKIYKSNYNYAFSMFKYEGMIREQIINYKFNNKAYLYRAFSELFLNDKKILGFLQTYDIIIPVPIHKKRRIQRGYNQCELIAREISKKANIEIFTDVLIKDRNVAMQSTLSKYDRKNNIKDAFKVRNINKIYKKRIVLFDDIYTTGSTINECKKLLKSAGAKEIFALTIAKD